MSASWIPSSPDELLDAATQLERFWADAERRGYAKPSLADELAVLEQHYGAVESGD
jgi:hypothetical protein